VDPDKISEPWLTTVILRCIKSRPEERYFSAEELLEDLQKGGSAQQPKTAIIAEDANQCPSCSLVNPPGLKYCRKCGTGLTRACPECGFEESVHAKYCGGCGTEVDRFLVWQQALTRMKQSQEKADLAGTVKQREKLEKEPFSPKGTKGRSVSEEIIELYTTAKQEIQKREELEKDARAALQSGNVEKALNDLDGLSKTMGGLNEDQQQLRSAVREALQQQVGQTIEQQLAAGQWQSAVKNLEDLRERLRLIGIGSAMFDQLGDDIHRQLTAEVGKALEQATESLNEQQTRKAQEEKRSKDALALSGQLMKAKGALSKSQEALRQAAVRQIESEIETAGAASLAAESWEMAIKELRSAAESLESLKKDSDVARALGEAWLQEHETKLRVAISDAEQKLAEQKQTKHRFQLEESMQKALANGQQGDWNAAIKELQAAEGTIGNLKQDTYTSQLLGEAWFKENQATLLTAIQDAQRKLAEQKERQQQLELEESVQKALANGQYEEALQKLARAGDSLNKVLEKLRAKAIASFEMALEQRFLQNYEAGNWEQALEEADAAIIRLLKLKSCIAEHGFNQPDYDALKARLLSNKAKALQNRAKKLFENKSWAAAAQAAASFGGFVGSESSLKQYSEESTRLIQLCEHERQSEVWWNRLLADFCYLGFIAICAWMGQAVFNNNKNVSNAGFVFWCLVPAVAGLASVLALDAGRRNAGKRKWVYDSNNISAMTLFVIAFTIACGVFGGFLVVNNNLAPLKGIILGCLIGIGPYMHICSKIKSCGRGFITKKTAVRVILFIVLIALFGYEIELRIRNYSVKQEQPRVTKPGVAINSTRTSAGSVDIKLPAPERIVEEPESAPGPDYIWIPGKWEWKGGAWMWSKGCWKTIPETGVSAGFQATLSNAIAGDAKGQFRLGLQYEYNFSGHFGIDITQAIIWYRKAADQGYDMAQKKIGQLYKRGKGVKQDYTEAVNWYRKAEVSNPGSSSCEIAWILATCPDANIRNPANAENLAKKGVSEKKNFYTLDVLAAAYAANGNFADAISTEKEAILLAGLEKFKSEFKARLALYESMTPFLDTQNSQ